MMYRSKLFDILSKLTIIQNNHYKIIHLKQTNKNNIENKLLSKIQIEHR